MTRNRLLAAVACSAFSLSACAKSPEAPRPSASSAAAAPARAAAPAPASNTVATASDAALPRVILHKSPTCGCCGAWGEHMRRHGFAVQVQETDDLEPIRKRLGVPAGKGSCHTAEVGRLVVEGHVPAADIKRLLAEGGDARGLTVPGMPIGSPGMEMPDGRVQAYTVERIAADGSTSPYARHGATPAR